MAPDDAARIRAMDAPPLRVMLVDDHEVVRNGLRAMLEATDDVVVAGEAGRACRRRRSAS
jgi:two-component system, NarL family, response regulator DevR